MGHCYVNKSQEQETRGHMSSPSSALILSPWGCHTLLLPKGLRAPLGPFLHVPGEGHRLLPPTSSWCGYLGALLP